MDQYQNLKDPVKGGFDLSHADTTLIPKDLAHALSKK